MNDKKYKTLIGIFLLCPMYILVYILGYIFISNFNLLSRQFNSFIALTLMITGFFMFPILGFMMANNHFKKSLNKKDNIIFYTGVTIPILSIIFMLLDEYLKIGIIPSGWSGLGVVLLIIIVGCIIHRICNIVFYGKVVGCKLMSVFLGIYTIILLILYSAFK